MNFTGVDSDSELFYSKPPFCLMPTSRHSLLHVSRLSPQAGVRLNEMINVIICVAFLSFSKHIHHSEN